MKRIFLTGGTGFLGSHLLAALEAGGHSVFAATRCDPSALPPRLADARVEWIPVEASASVVEDIKPHAIIHLATDYGSHARLRDTLLANEAWPLGLLEAGVRVGTEVFLNTDSFFAKPGYDYPHMRPYTLSKTNFLAWGRTVAAGSSIRFLTLRLEHVYGENDRPDKFVPALLRQLKAGETVQATSGIQRRDFIHASDVAKAFMTVLENHAGLDPAVDDIEVGTGCSVTVRSFVELARSICRSTLA